MTASNTVADAVLAVAVGCGLTAAAVVAMGAVMAVVVSLT